LSNEHIKMLSSGTFFLYIRPENEAIKLILSSF
jgi:hypothetical protein